MLLTDIAQRLGLTLVGQDREITGVNTLADAGPQDVSFLANPKYADQVATTRAGAIITDEVHAKLAPCPVLVSAQPYLDFARLVQIMAKPLGRFSGQSDKAFIHPGATVHPSVAIAPFVYIGDGAQVDAGTRLFPHVHVGEDCRIGKNCTIYPRVTLMDGTLVGDKVILHAGVVLGSDGFGFAQAAQGLEKFPQIGRVVIEDNVEIGANTTIDRAALGETRIGRGTKIDNLVQIGHNVQVGENSIIVAQVGIAGSANLGKNVVLAGQVGVAGHLTIGDGCRVAAKGGIHASVPPGTDLGGGLPSIEYRQYLKTVATIPKLPEMSKRLRRLEKELARLREACQQDNPSGT
ncbi:UDP-3-O-(3-hydroxymyristoyl)glucosamine N-acyltransferase [Desulfoplanes formicivorans]|uniref:UDP-3-O-acylglucosamine N-acyltransferase n=1 Tax=Desulfoplanes formicivorans TaxID=1592317 RepID=A0A194AE77_9BACT|nr:UDP-3-O-(3-hydroxymyristoyl)glucosamine N-acyltransferase [Desulfoplanes formicivorans]GAU07505.1 UDP-3-O-(3-hydroxymyristoyl) glucosamine N-acyltransferase [Desulfoplanes formicivorans]